MYKWLTTAGMNRGIRCMLDRSSSSDRVCRASGLVVWSRSVSECGTRVNVWLGACIGVPVHRALLSLAFSLLLSMRTAAAVPIGLCVKSIGAHFGNCHTTPSLGARQLVRHSGAVFCPCLAPMIMRRRSKCQKPSVLTVNTQFCSESKLTNTLRTCYLYGRSDSSSTMHPTLRVTFL